MCLFEKFADRLIIVSTAIHNPRQQKKEKCVWVCHIVRVRISTDSPLPTQKKEKEIVAATDFGTILAGHIFHRIRKREWNA